MTFKEFASKYLNPAVRPPSPWVVDWIKESGVDENVVLDWVTFARKVVAECVYAGKTATIEDILAAWDKAHPQGGFVLKTPFGDVKFADKPITQCSLKEVVENVAGAVVQALKS